MPILIFYLWVSWRNWYKSHLDPSRFRGFRLSSRAQNLISYLPPEFSIRVNIQSKIERFLYVQRVLCSALSARITRFSIVIIFTSHSNNTPSRPMIPNLQNTIDQQREPKETVPLVVWSLCTSPSSSSHTRSWRYAPNDSANCINLVSNDNRAASNAIRLSNSINTGNGEVQRVNRLIG